MGMEFKGKSNSRVLLQKLAFTYIMFMVNCDKCTLVG